MENTGLGSLGNEDPPAKSRSFDRDQENPQTFQAVLADSPGLVLMVDAQGRIVDASPLVRLMASNWPASLSSVLPAQVARDRMEMVRRVLAQHEQLAVRGLIRGELCWTLMRRLADPVRGAEVVLMTVRPLCLEQVAELPPGVDSRYVKLDAAHHDLGELGGLSPRELEVLSLIGSGMTTGEIAKALHRSLKTVENHRTAIGKKLKVKSLLQLARIARRAGLPDVAPLFAEPGTRVEVGENGRVGPKAQKLG